jgi:hypothetical protein
MRQLAFGRQATPTVMRIAPFILVMGLVAGCATSEPRYTALNDGSNLEKKQPAPTDDMTTGEKTAYYLGWFSLAGLFGWGWASTPHDLASVPPVPLFPP